MIKQVEPAFTWPVDDEKCGSCRYWRSNTGDMGSCRRNPPTVVSLPGGTHLDKMSVWPATSSDMWCGEFAGKSPQDPRGQR